MSQAMLLQEHMPTRVRTDDVAPRNHGWIGVFCGALFGAFAAPLLANQADAIVVPEQPQLEAQIHAADQRLFELYFDRCEPAAMVQIVADDVEFYHDVGGVIAHDAESLLADYQKSCEARAKPDSWRSRREAVADSYRIYPIPGFGALQQGQHRFYERKGEGPEALVGEADFVIVWQAPKTVGEAWRVARILSYAHRKAATPADQSHTTRGKADQPGAP